MDELQIIGRVEEVSFPEIDIQALPARIDTGARTSTIWASYTEEQGDGLVVIFFAKGSSFYTGKEIYIPSYETVFVASSNGYSEERYKVRLLLRINGRKIRASFTLADRSTQVYPVLIGRNVLRGKFMVNVKAGKPLLSKEKEREITKKQTAKKLKRSEGKNLQ